MKKMMIVMMAFLVVGTVCAKKSKGAITVKNPTFYPMLFEAKYTKGCKLKFWVAKKTTKTFAPLNSDCCVTEIATWADDRPFKVRNWPKSAFKKHVIKPHDSCHPVTLTVGMTGLSYKTKKGKTKTLEIPKALEVR